MITLIWRARADGGKPEPYFSRALARHIDRRRKKTGDELRRVCGYCTGCSVSSDLQRVVDTVQLAVGDRQLLGSRLRC